MFVLAGTIIRIANKHMQKYSIGSIQSIKSGYLATTKSLR
jgi:hypothetical protein